MTEQAPRRYWATAYYTDAEDARRRLRLARVVIGLAIVASWFRPLWADVTFVQWAEWVGITTITALVVDHVVRGIRTAQIGDDK